MEEFVRFGAPEDILYTAHPHIGTDLLRDIVKRMREEILRLGAEIRFSTRLDDILIEKGEVCGVVANGEVIPCEQLILAIGHSARDTMRMLMKRGVAVEPKAFAVGARIEHPQRLINEAQYKAYANHPRLKAAEYRLTYPASNGRGVYTFCMCPGGYVLSLIHILGDTSDMIHYTLGKDLAKYHLNEVLTIGDMARYITQGAFNNLTGVHIEHFTDKEALICYLRPYEHKDCMLLVKGSRGMKLDEVVDALVKKEEEVVK